MDEAVTGAAGHLARFLESAPLLLPSSLSREDDLVRSLRRSLRTYAVSSSVVVPEHPLRAATGAVITGQRLRWREVRLSLPDKADREVLLPRRLLGQNPLVYATHVDAVARRGPFQLDLLSRYVHPRHRIRQVIDRDRAGLAAEVNMVRGPEWCIIGFDGPPGLVAVTHDIVAGELFALCMAERFFDKTVEFSSPWEDRVVQRATELELGARTPDDIRIDVMGQPGHTGEAVDAIVDHVRQRIGIRSGNHV
jgi:hypothetical protein